MNPFAFGRARRCSRISLSITANHSWRIGPYTIPSSASLHPSGRRPRRLLLLPLPLGALAEAPSSCSFFSGSGWGWAGGAAAGAAGAAGGGCCGGFRAGEALVEGGGEGWFRLPM